MKKTLRKEKSGRLLTARRHPSQKLNLCPNEDKETRILLS